VTAKVELSTDLRALVAQKLRGEDLPQVYGLIASKPEREERPYPGLRAFTSEEAGIFFGRGREVDELIRRIRISERQFLAVVGPSGVGKSSLIKAGLIPRLRENAISGSKDWLTIEMTPAALGSDPFLPLVAGLCRFLPSEINMPPRKLAEEIFNSPSSIIKYIEIIMNEKAAGGKIFLFIDQFEELFTIVSDVYVDKFISMFRFILLTKDVFIMITSRVDFLLQATKKEFMGELLQEGMFSLSPPGATGLIDMIRRPAEAAGVEIEEGLPEIVLNDAGHEPGALPLVAFTLSELYKRSLPERRLSVDAYHQLGGIKGAIGERANELVEAMPSETRDALSQLFDALVHVSPSGSVSRSRVEKSRLVTTEIMNRLIDGLVDARLLHAEERDGHPVVEVAHEALFDCWPQLRDWLENNLSRLRLQAELEADMARWIRNGRDPGFLVPSGKLLDDAKSLITRPDVTLASELVNYVEMSVTKAVRSVHAQKTQTVGLFVGGVVTEFSNLVTAMIGFCDLLLVRTKPGESNFSYLMQIKQNANRAADLINRLTAWLRQEPVQQQILDVTDVLAELLDLLRRLIGNNIKLNMMHGRDLGFIKIDRGQLEQVIINLVVNACDAMADGGIVTIRTCNAVRSMPTDCRNEVMPSGDYVQIEVTDTGVGISNENLDRIFEPFYTTKEGGSGAGLGLSRVLEILKQSGGFLFVESVPGEGSTFTVFLPHCQSIQAEEPAIRRVASYTLTGEGTILVAEPEDAVRHFVSRALRDKGYKVQEAKSGEAALELITYSHETFNVLLTEVDLPRVDGLSLFKQVQEAHREIEVIFMSTHTEEALRRQLGEGAKIRLLRKPFSLKQLVIRVKEVISGERLM